MPKYTLMFCVNQLINYDFFVKGQPQDRWIDIHDYDSVVLAYSWCTTLYFGINN